MTDRAPSGGTLPNACPFLALEEDRDRRSAVADGRHRCYAEPAPQPRALTYQETYCLSPAFAACRSFLDWAARAAAEPVAGQDRVTGAATQPLAPIPGPVTPPPASPNAIGRPPLNPVLPPAQVLPPPPPGYTPPPAWQPPAPAWPPSAPTAPAGRPGVGVPLAPIPAEAEGGPPPPGWQPPGTPPSDTTGFTWAVPPPWVAQPEMRTTAGLPDSARPPLDAERLGWTSAGRSGALPPGPLDEDATDGYPEWPPAPRSASVSGTFATRRREPFAPLPTAGSDQPAVADAPPMASLVGADLDADHGTEPEGWAPDPSWTAARAVDPDDGPGMDPDRATGIDPLEETDERWIGEDRVIPTTTGATMTAVAGPALAASETAAWSAWGETADPPQVWPQPPSGPAPWPADPVAIKVGDGPSSSPSATGGPWQGMMGDPGNGNVPIEPAPPASGPSAWSSQGLASGTAALAGPVSTGPGGTDGVAPGPVSAGQPPAVAPDAVGDARRGGSRWLPSFLSRDPHEETGTTAVAARTGPAAAVSAATTLPADAWADEGSAVPDGSSAAVSGSASATATSPSRSATGAEPVVATAGAAPDEAADPDPPGSLAPRRRRQPPGVPVDASAPTARQSQTRPATRAKGSGEWNQPKTATAGSGRRRFLPGGLPPLLLGVGALFLGALALFLLPGMLAGGGDAPTPVPTIEVGGGVAASLGLDASIAPTETEPPAGEFQPYVVERGDTLIDIARRFSVSQEVLICANRELRRNPNLLSVGQELQIPPEDWACPSQAKPTKKPGKKAAATEPPASVAP